jgi:Mce-associated membrane protein
VTEPNEPEDVVRADEAEETPEAAEVAAAPGETSAVDEPPAAEPESEPEPLTLPDESHSRTTELAARLRQSALAQVEAARAALASDPGAAEAAPTVRRSGTESTIPALDDPQRTNGPDPSAQRPQEPDPEPRQEQPEPEPEVAPETGPPESDETAEAESLPASRPTAIPSSEPIAVAAAAMAGHDADAAQSFLSGPGDGGPSRAVTAVRLATVIGAVLAVAAAVVAVVFGLSSSGNKDVAAARSAGVAAAKPEVAAALSYDYRTLDADFTKAEKGMTTKFRASYARTAATSVTPLATQTNTTTNATIAAAGVISASSNKVLVLVFADQASTNKHLAGKTRLDRSVIEVTMVKQGDRWLIDDLQPF